MEAEFEGQASCSILFQAWEYIKPYNLANKWLPLRIYQNVFFFI